MNLVSVEDIIRAAWLAVNNTARDADSAKKLAGMGFPDKRMRELENRTVLVEELHKNKVVRFSEGLEISEQIEKEAQSLRPLFKDHVAAARFAFRREPARLRTFLPKAIGSNKWNWIAQAAHFYTHILPYAGQLATHGVSHGELEQAKVSVGALKRMREDRMLKKGVAEDSTESRNQAIKQLKSLLKEFHIVARLALKENPQKLEAFGLVVKLQKA
ncbi:hypothetical protein [Catalinimonas niigatensis]|uniref:hypothetical protein n=1 Tax=Catalinimonas niigatensis TaxID=1397264 RepID=UPI002664E6FB|nr:hypothetical protein [Catalinimonas niigatensis]WPP49858.1 hypothetical protein PZB72_24605 [Catalinimonas niigatensis]